jgi:hypothetical protein
MTLDTMGGYCKERAGFEKKKLGEKTASVSGGWNLGRASNARLAIGSLERRRRQTNQEIAQLINSRRLA